MMVKLVMVSRKPALTVPGTSATKPVSHRMFDASTHSFVTCRKHDRTSLTSGKNYAGPLLVVDEGSSLAISGRQCLQVDETGMLTVTCTEDPA